MKLIPQNDYAVIRLLAHEKTSLHLLSSPFEIYIPDAWASS